MVHNYYGSSAPSGENNVLEAERRMLEKNGNEVFVFSKSSDAVRQKGIVGAVGAGMFVPWNPFSAKSFERALELYKPDLVHVHNTFPIISPAIFHSKRADIPVVLTLHNYRLVCPAAIPMRDGKPCTLCVNAQSVIPSIKYACYRSSRLATLPLAFNVALHRKLKTWTDKVDAFVVLSDFQKSLMVKGGLPEEKIHTKPNFYSGNPAVLDYSKRENYVVFVGRLSQEKGISTLISAWRILGKNAPEIRIIGDGPQQKDVIACDNLKIKYLGLLPSDETQRQISGSKLLVLPSEWFEGFPMVLQEALAFGTPSIVSQIGPLPDIIAHGYNGLTFKPGDASDLADAVRYAIAHPALMSQLSSNARFSFEDYYTENANYKTLVEIYGRAKQAARVRYEEQE